METSASDRGFKVWGNGNHSFLAYEFVTLLSDTLLICKKVGSCLKLISSQEMGAKYAKG